MFFISVFDIFSFWVWIVSSILSVFLIFVSMSISAFLCLLIEFGSPNNVQPQRGVN